MSKPTPKFIAYVCVFVTLITLTSSTLSVYNLQALGQSDQTLLNISYSIANYGFVPLGKTIVGKLVHSPKFGDECTPQVETDVDYDNKFMLIPRGKCEFVTKTLNAQKLGAQLAIIMDDQEHSNLVIMKDNGYGHKANIPSIFINYKDGQKLKKLLLDNEGEEDAEVIMKITFHSEKTDKVSVNFYLQANNRHSYRFVQTFTKFYPKIKDDIDLILVYYNIKCPECLATDCYNEKAYCAINYVHEQSANGRLILDQQIREQLVWRSYPEKWWKYMKQIGDQCNSISQLQVCQERALKKVGIDPAAFKNVFKTSFGQGEYHQLLVEDQEHLAVAGINRYPAVTLNNQKLKGSLHAEFVFDDICNLLKSPPQECTKYVESKTTIQTKVENNWLTLILVITLGVITFSIIFCLYRRHMKKKISKEMQGRVDDMVSKYIEFYSQRSKS